MSKRRGRLVAFFSRDKQEVGYVWPAILAVLVHAVVVMFSVINLEGKDAEPESSSIVNATLVSTETYTNQAQQVNDDQAAMSASSQSPPQEAPAPPSRPLEEAVIDQAEELAADRDTQALKQARAEAEAQAQRRAEEAERQALEAAAREAERAEQQAEEQRRREELARQEQEAEAQRRREEEQARQAQEAEEQRRREEEQARQAQEAEEQRRREEEARQAQEAAEAERQRRLEGQAEAAANARQAEQAANSFISIVRRAVEQAWLIPGGASDTMSATVQVRLGPSGEVLATSVATSSGDSAFDRSAIQAVEHAAPFSELRELSSEQQRNLRQFNLRFTPGDVR